MEKSKLKYLKTLGEYKRQAMSCSNIPYTLSLLLDASVVFGTEKVLSCAEYYILSQEIYAKCLVNLTIFL